MKAIVNLSTKKYWRGQDRLIQSMEGKTSCSDLLMFKSEQEVGSPAHKENNYGFKVKAIQKAISKGYSIVLWLDASMYVIKDLQSIFDLIEKDGYFFQDSGWLNNQWTNERTTEYFGTNEGKMLSSGVLGLNFNSPIASEFFQEWYKSMNDGMFNGSHDNHRHDQSCASIIAHKLNMKLQEGNSYFIYGNLDEETINKEALIIANGIC